MLIYNTPMGLYLLFIYTLPLPAFIQAGMHPSRLSQDEYKELYGHHTEEHGEWEHRRIAHRRRIGGSELARIGQGWRIGVDAGKHAKQGIEVEMKDIASDQSTHNGWHNGYQSSPQQPVHALLSEHDIKEVFARTESHTGKEEAKPHLPKHEVGRNGVVSDQMMLRSEVADEYGYDERTASEPEAKRLRYAWEIERHIGKHTSESYAEEDRQGVRIVELAALVAHLSLDLGKTDLCADHRDAVTHLQLE